MIEKLHGSLAWWLTLIFSGAAVALTHYLGAFVLVILNLHWLLTLRTQSRGTQNRAFHVRWVGAMLATGAILALWVAYAIGLTRSGSVDSDFNAALAFQLFATLMAAGTSVNLDRYTLVTLVFTVVYFAGVLLYARKWRENALLVLLMAVLPPLAIYALSLPETPFYAPKPEERYMIIFAPLVFAGIGLALAAAARLKRVGAVMALVLGGGLLALYAAAYLRDLDTRYVRDDYATMLQTVDLLAAADDPVLFVSDDRYPLVLYHLNRASDDGYTDLRAVGITSPEGNVQDSVMLDLLDGASRFWVVQIERHFRDPDGLTIAWFDARFERVYHEDIDYNSVTLYAADDLESPRADTVLPPVVSEARPFDTVRVGAYGEVTWRYGNTVIRRDLPDEGRLNWGLSQFTVYPAYPNGAYEVIAGDESYPFHVTHSQDALTRPPEVVLNTDFGDLTLLGYDIAREEVRRGEAFEITLHWHVDEVPQQNYTVFAQLLGPFRNDGPVWASDDRYPADTPTTALWQGLTFTDTHTLAVPPDLPAGTHQAAFGLYLLETGERLPLAQNTAQDAAPNAVIIDGLRVVE